MPSSDPKRTSRSEAVLSPMPGMPGMSSEGSPLSPRKSGTSRRRDAVARLDALRRVHVDVGHAAGREQHGDVLGCELERVAIVRDHGRRDAGLLRPRGERADHVVGLVSLERDVAIAERLDERAEVRLLLAQQIGRRLAGGLVAGELREPVRRLLVPGHQHAFRPVVAEQAHQHVREAEQRVRREAVGRRELLRQRVVRAVAERVAVDQEELARARRRVVQVEVLGLGDHASNRTGPAARASPEQHGPRSRLRACRPPPPRTA